MESLSLKQTADMLGKSARQVRRMVTVGVLPASGGGHGRALRFDPAAVARFQPSYRRRWRPFACRPGLFFNGMVPSAYRRRWRPFASQVPKWQVFAKYAAAILAADADLRRANLDYFALSRVGGNEKHCYKAFFDYLARVLARNDNRVDAARRLWRGGNSAAWLGKLPALRSVRGDLVDIARALDKYLDSAGWDFLLAAKIVRHSPTRKTIRRFRRAGQLKTVLDKASRRGANLNQEETKALNRLRKMYLGHTAMMQLHRRAEFGAVAFLSDSSVAEVLGVHRQQAARMRQRVFARLGKNVILAIIALQIPVNPETMSRPWLRSLHGADSELFGLKPRSRQTRKRVGARCPWCGAEMFKKEPCPACGRRA
jgi:predicted site-specific integrase-resolvase